jgi:hypothetical protein
MDTIALGVRVLIGHGVDMVVGHGIVHMTHFTTAGMAFSDLTPIDMGITEILHIGDIPLTMGRPYSLESQTTVLIQISFVEQDDMA